MHERKKRVLIADDDSAILEVLSLILEDEGYAVEIASDGALLENLHEDVPDLLLLDIWMSGLDGSAICKRLKGQEATSHLPIILFSANRDTERIAREAGANDFLAKPFEVDELLAKVCQYIDPPPSANPQLHDLSIS